MSVFEAALGDSSMETMNSDSMALLGCLGGDCGRVAGDVAPPGLVV